MNAQCGEGRSLLKEHAANAPLCMTFAQHLVKLLDWQPCQSWFSSMPLPFIARQGDMGAGSLNDSKDSLLLASAFCSTLVKSPCHNPNACARGILSFNVKRSQRGNAETGSAEGEFDQVSCIGVKAELKDGGRVQERGHCN